MRNRKIKSKENDKKKKEKEKKRNIGFIPTMESFIPTHARNPTVKAKDCL